MDIGLQYLNRAWCRLEQIVGWWCMKPPLSDHPATFQRIRMEGVCSNPAIKDPLVYELDRFELIKESVPPDCCPCENPGKGCLSVESDRPPLVIMSRMLEFHEVGGLGLFGGVAGRGVRGESARHTH